MSIITLSKSLQFASSVSPPPDETEALDCYEGLSAKFKGTVSSLCKMAATMHCLAID